MKHKSKFHSFPTETPAESCVDIDNTFEIHHELSYYLNGGTDIEGDALSKNGDAEFDTEEQAEEILTEGFSSVALGDPKMSKFRLAEQLGVKAAEALAASKDASASAGEE